LREEIAALKDERDAWRDAAEKNPKVSKLFAEKAELQREKQALQTELGRTPESLTA